MTTTAPPVQTTKAPRAKAATAAPVDTAQTLRTIQSELSDPKTGGFLERRDEIELLLVGNLAAEHTFLLGPPGTGKSALVRGICDRVTGANYWETLFDRQLPLESLFGPVDIIEFEKSGDWQRRVDGYLPTAHMVFGDETGKAGPAVLNPLLAAMNERIFHNGKGPQSIPLISFVGASNEELESELGAVWDRFMLRKPVRPIVEPSNFASLLASAVVSGPAFVPTTVPLAELQQAITVDVPAVALPPGVIDTLMQLRTELRAEQIEPSDRRWKKCVRILQATAFLAGRNVVDDDDLAILRHVLWDAVPQISMVEKKVLSLTSPITKAAMELQAMVEEIDADITARHGKSMEDRAKYGAEAQFKVTNIAGKLAKQTESANRAGRATTRLDAVSDSLKALKMRIFVELMNVPADRAATMGN